MLPAEPSQALSLDAAAAWRDQLHASGKRLVFTSGCFDILHAGHVRYLAQARALGDALIVALNGDESVRALKGPDRPVHSEADRAEVLLGLSSVDAVVIFNTPRTTNLISAIRPHLFAKGGDYTIATLNPEERAALEAAGSEIQILPELTGRSTSASLAKLNSPPSPPRTRFAILGSGAGSLFDTVADAASSGSLNLDIVLVASDNPAAGILAKATARNIPALAIEPGPLPGQFSPAALKELTDRLRAAQTDWILCAGFGRRLEDPVTAAFPNRILKIHPSLLPDFPGPNAIADAIAANAHTTGCTAHLVTSDGSNPILAQESVPIAPDETAASLRPKINAAERALLPRVIAAHCLPTP